MIKILFFALALIVPVCLSGQDSSNDYDNSSDLKFGIGAAAGFSTGYGLSFRYWPANWGIQFTTAPYYTENDSQISLGATVLNTIKNDGRIKLFLYLGNHVLYEKWSDYSYDGSNSDPSKYTTWILGAGPGFEFIILEKISFNLMFGVASYTEYSNNYDTDWMLNMTAETGLYYKF